MVNSQNIAILSEKVAALEAALKNADIGLPEVDTSDNGKSLQVVEGAWATGSKIPEVVNALDSTSTIDALSAAQGKALDESIKAITGVSVLSIPANTYSTWGEALTALATAFGTLTQAQKERAYLIWDGRLKYNIQDMTESNNSFTCTVCGGSSLVVRSMYIASTPYYLVSTTTTSSTTIANNTSSAQTESIELKY